MAQWYHEGERRTVKGWREALLYSQTEFAARLGVKKNTIWTWEKRKRTPGITLRRHIAEFFGEYGVPPDAIIWPEEERQIGETATNDTRRAS